MEMYLQIIIAITFFCIFYIPSLMGKPKYLLYYLLHFFLFASLPIFWAGILNPDTFVDSDVTTHQGIINMILNRDLFKYDDEMQLLFKIYPRGYHLLLSPFVLLGIPFTILTKFLGLLSVISTPLLLYYLTWVIYSEKRIAYFAALFSYLLTPLYDYLFKGLPTSPGVPFYLLTLIFIFNYLKTGRFHYILWTVVFMVATFYVHFVDYVLLIIPVTVLLITYLIKRIIREKSFPPFSLKITLVLLAAMIPLVKYLIDNYRLLSFSSLTYTKSFGTPELFHYSYISFWDLLINIGIFPILFLIIFLVSVMLKKWRKYPFQEELFFVSVFMLGAAAVFLIFDKLNFLGSYRYIPFLATFFYLIGLPAVISMIFDSWFKNKAIRTVIILLSLIPSGYYINQRISWGVFPYDYHHLVNIDPKPDLNSNDRITFFQELRAIGEYFKSNTDIDAVIACPMWYGDLIRLYSQRSVTSSWKIAGLACYTEKAGHIYREYLNNSDKLYNDPDYLYHKYRATYFIFDKSVREFLTIPSVEVFQTKHLKVLRVIPNKEAISAI